MIDVNSLRNHHHDHEIMYKKNRKPKLVALASCATRYTIPRRLYRSGTFDKTQRWIQWSLQKDYLHNIHNTKGPEL